MAPSDTAGELARRAVAQLLLAEAAVPSEEYEVISVLGELLSLVVLRTLRIAVSNSMHANRTQLNVFDVLATMQELHTTVPQLYEYFVPRQVRQKPAAKPPTALPVGRCLLRAAGDDDEEEPVDIGPRPPYIPDEYPPLPRAYTFRRTETRGIRESDKVAIAKAKGEQQRKVESSLYRLLDKTNMLRETVNYEDAEAL